MAAMNSLVLIEINGCYGKQAVLWEVNVSNGKSMVLMESQWLLWNVNHIAMGVTNCYFKSLFTMEVYGCYRKTKVAMEINGCYGKSLNAMVS
jgi:hypothetical protein